MNTKMLNGSGIVIDLLYQDWRRTISQDKRNLKDVDDKCWRNG
jgi:hypothetical protein